MKKECTHRAVAFDEDKAGYVCQTCGMFLYKRETPDFWRDLMNDPNAHVDIDNGNGGLTALPNSKRRRYGK